MKEDQENITPSISENTLRSIEEAQGAYKRIAENLASIIPKLPKFDLPQIPQFEEREPIEIINPNVVREQNAWERHKEVIDIQNALLGVQSKLLDEQKSNARLTKVVIGLSVATIVIALISLFA